MNTLNNHSLDPTIFIKDLSFAIAFSVGYITLNGLSGRLVFWIKSSFLERFTHTPLPSYNEQEISSIIKIQSLIRRNLAQKYFDNEKKHILSYNHFLAAIPFTQTPSILQNLPRAYDGKTPVYFPPDLPVVLKECGHEKNQKRFDQMKVARHLSEENQWNLLVIPKARVYGEFIIESKLPLPKAPDIKAYIGFYLENKEQLTPAVIEFTKFLCKTNFDCIVDVDCHPYSNLSNAPIGRYDNICMFIDDDGIAKIGLVDLERFNPKTIKHTQKSVYRACLDAINLFPYHFDEIIKVILEVNPLMDIYRLVFEKEQKQCLKFFKKIYQNHVTFLKQNEITIQTPTKLVKITNKRKHQIKLSLAKLLKKIKITLFKENESITDIVKTHSLLLDELIDATYDLLQKLLERQIDYCGGLESISTTPMLLSARSISIWDDEIDKRFSVATDRIKVKLLELLSPQEKVYELSHQIIRKILKEMQKGGEIALFNPKSPVDDQFCLILFL